jgi:hypothetical protein
LFCFAFSLCWNPNHSLIPKAYDAISKVHSTEAKTNYAPVSGFSQWQTENIDLAAEPAGVKNGTVMTESRAEGPPPAMATATETASSPREEAKVSEGAKAEEKKTDDKKDETPSKVSSLGIIRHCFANPNHISALPLSKP